MNSAVWEIYRYHFPNESEIDELYNEWWQVLRNGTPALSGVDLLRVDSYVRDNAAADDTVMFGGQAWTGCSWRNRRSRERRIVSSGS